MEDFNEGTAGPTVSVPESVRDVFQLIFTDTIVDHIVRETNRYACLIMGESKYEKWERVTSDDILAYFGIMVIMGLVDRPSLHDYWKRDPLFYCPPIAERMARDRFLEIHRYLHFVDNSTITPPGELSHCHWSLSLSLSYTHSHNHLTLTCHLTHHHFPSSSTGSFQSHSAHHHLSLLIIIIINRLFSEPPNPKRSL